MKIRCGIIGSGWRAEFFIRAGVFLPDIFDICGVVTNNKEKRKEYGERYGLKCYSAPEELIAAEKPEFCVVSVKKTVGMDVSLKLLAMGMPVLAETPAADTLDRLNEFYQRMPKKAMFQVAEQYHLRPDAAAVLNYIQSGRIGTPHYARVSYTNDFHGISLMRKLLGINFENAVITARTITSPGMPGAGRGGLPEKEEILVKPQVIAILNFGEKAGVYDFEADQHRSFIRSSQLLVKGERGEINNQEIRYMMDYRTPMVSHFQRINMGEYENLEGYGLKGIIADSQWYYHNPYQNSRLVDDEIAVAKGMELMGNYVRGGESFYNFAQAAQDMYLAEMIQQAVQTGEDVQTVTQCWALQNESLI